MKLNILYSIWWILLVAWEKESILFYFPEIPGCFFNLSRIVLLLRITQIYIYSFYIKDSVHIEDFSRRHDL